MTNNAQLQSAMPIPAAYSRADASGSNACATVVTGRQALIDQAMRARSQILGKLNQGARQHLLELAQAIAERRADD
jgi:hypothetical protein